MTGVNRRGRPARGRAAAPEKRQYRSAVREEQAAQTRARILEAASALFVDRGYGRTTMKAVAEAAGVATDTVYATFGTKARLLTALIDQRLVPAGDAANVMERPEVVQIRDEPDQRRQIELFARDMTAVVERVGPMFEMMRAAAAVEPEMADVYAEMNGYRLQNLTRFVEWLAARGPLRVPVEQAAEATWTLASPDVARLLRNGRGWSAEQFSSWLADTLVRVLLPDS